MATVGDFLEEVNRLFGFYFDADMAFALTKRRLEEMQKQLRLGDSNDFSYSEDLPTGTPEQVLQKSLHRTTFGALKERMDKSGTDSQLAAQAMIAFTYHIWEEKYRGSLTNNAGVPIHDTNSDIMGDLRLIRNSIIHNKGVADAGVARCKVLKHFEQGQPIFFTGAIIYEIIRAIRNEFAQRA
ncbi:MAG: hypothetical protein WAV22_11180 [Porticoccaceae bacterium]